MTEESVNQEKTSDESLPESEINAVDEIAEQEDVQDTCCSGDGSKEESAITLDETLVAMEERLDEAEKKAAEYLDGWQRTQASFANYRKRTEAEQAHWRSAANANLLARLLPILDDFQRAFDALPADFEGHSWLSGIKLIQRKIRAILDAESVVAIELSPGDSFDPLYHQAVVYQEVEGFEDGQIVAEVEKGYILGDRVLRPSMVVVAKAPMRVKAKVEKESLDDEPGVDDEEDIIEGEFISQNQGDKSAESNEDAEDES